MRSKTFFTGRKKSIANALRGVIYTLQTQKNTWVHSTITLIVLLLSTWLRIPFQDWAILILMIGVVWTAEIFNTAVETVVDLASPEFNCYAKICKDVSAAAVLISATTSVIVGLLILGPPLWQKLFNN